jgi:hypothetical protein
MDKASLKRVALIVTNTAMMLAWARVLLVVVSTGWKTLADDSNDVCENTLRPIVLTALAVSYIELFTSVIGLTRSNPIQVLLFSTVRAGVEVLLAPLLPCGCWQHLLTVICWAFGDTIRFGCFAVDGIAPQLTSLVKSVRYTCGPILFPLGAAGEMLMAIRAASDGRPGIYVAAALWPVGFYPLMKQLQKQRRKFFQSKDKAE